MKIAVTYENEMVFQHFGHTPQFKIYEIADKSVVNAWIVDVDEDGHGALAGFLVKNDVSALICGGIGGGAQAALASAGIRLYGGVGGYADDAVTALLAGELVYDSAVRCNHANHEHGADGQHCRGHRCGSHSCH